MMDVRGALSRHAHFTFIVVTLLLLFSVGRLGKIGEWVYIAFFILGFLFSGIILHFVERMVLSGRKQEMWKNYEKYGPVALQEMAPTIALHSNLLSITVMILINLLFVMVVGK